MLVAPQACYIGEHRVPFSALLRDVPDTRHWRDTLPYAIWCAWCPREYAHEFFAHACARGDIESARRFWRVTVDWVYTQKYFLEFRLPVTITSWRVKYMHYFLLKRYEIILLQPRQLTSGSNGLYVHICHCRNTEARHLSYTTPISRKRNYLSWYDFWAYESYSSQVPTLSNDDRRCHADISLHSCFI